MAFDKNVTAADKRNRHVFGTEPANTGRGRMSGKGGMRPKSDVIRTRYPSGNYDGCSSNACHTPAIPVFLVETDGRIYL